MSEPQKTTNSNGEANENLEISFLGFRLKCNNPGSKTIIIVILSLAFFGILVAFGQHISFIKSIFK
jgi:hypothetical protein